MSRFLCVGDIHFSDKPPSSCTDSYLDDLFDILWQTVPLMDELECDACVWAGDVFHSKTPSRTSHRTVQRAIELVQGYKGKLRIVPGNHDMLNDREESIFETQPLGVLLQAGAHYLHGWDDEFRDLYGVPWQQEWTPAVVHKVFEEWQSLGLQGMPLSECLVVAHAPLYPPGLELPYEFYPTSDWAAQMDYNGFCYYGHVHERHGIFKGEGNVVFCNTGAITRGSLHEHDLKRKVAVTTWSYQEGFIERPLKHKPAEEVFRILEKMEIKETQQRLDEFLSSIGQSTIEVTSIEAVMKQVRELGLSPEIEKVISELLEGSH